MQSSIRSLFPAFKAAKEGERSADKIQSARSQCYRVSPHYYKSTDPSSNQNKNRLCELDEYKQAAIDRERTPITQLCFTLYRGGRDMMRVSRRPYLFYFVGPAWRHILITGAVCSYCYCADACTHCFQHWIAVVNQLRFSHASTVRASHCPPISNRRPDEISLEVFRRLE